MRSMSPIGSDSFVPSTVAGRKFIGGEPMKPGHEQVDRLLVELAGRVDLLEQALAQHRHPVAERHGLDLVVGDVDGGDAERVLDAGDLGAHLAAQLGVEVRERLVEQEGVGVAHEGPAHGHPLALAARELRRLAVEELGQLEHLGRPLHPLVDLVVGVLRRRSGKAMFSYTVRCG